MASKYHNCNRKLENLKYYLHQAPKCNHLRKAFMSNRFPENVFDRYKQIYVFRLLKF